MVDGLRAVGSSRAPELGADGPAQGVVSLHGPSPDALSQAWALIQPNLMKHRADLLGALGEIEARLDVIERNAAACRRAVTTFKEKLSSFTALIEETSFDAR